MEGDHSGFPQSTLPVLDELRGQNPHVTSQADVLDTSSHQGFVHLRVEFNSVAVVLVGNHLRVEMIAASPLASLIP